MPTEAAFDGAAQAVATVPAKHGNAGGHATAFQAADPVSQDMAGWFPTLGSADRDLLFERDRITSRVRDLVRNNGWASGLVSSEIDNAIGLGLRLSSKPDYKALGLDAAWAHEWAETVEAEWRGYALDPNFFCDAARHHQMGGLFGLAYRHYVVDGDALGVLLWLERGGNFATALRIVDPDRLSNPDQRPDDDRLRGGIEIDEHTAAVAYHIRKRHPNDVMGTMDSWVWERIPRETAWGRPIVVHHYDKERDGLSRGIGRLTSVLERMKMLDRYDKVELQAAVLNAILAAFIESPFDHSMLDSLLDSSDGVSNYQAARSAYHENKKLTLGGVQIPVMMAGEKLSFQTAQRPNTAFAEFESAALRNIAAGTGTSYEQISKDWSKSNYSSARASLLEVWKTIIRRRESFGTGFATPVFMAFLEEAIDRGRVKLPANAPDFYSHRAAYTRCRWIGPGRGWVDPVKEKQAAILGMVGGLSTLEDEAAEQGKDHQEILDQIAREIEECKKAGIVHPALRSFATLMTPYSNEPGAADRPGGETA